MTTAVIMFFAIALAVLAGLIAVMGWPGFGYYCAACYSVAGVGLAALWVARVVRRRRNRPRPLPRATARVRR